MDYVPFHKTRMGERLYCKTVPDLVQAIERMSVAIEKLIEITAKRQSHEKISD